MGDMALFRARHNLAESLRRDARLLLPADPGTERLLEYVHLFNENAKPAGGGRIDVDGWQELYLSSPSAISHDIAAETGTMPGMGVAFFLENHAHMRPFGLSAGSPHTRKQYDMAMRLIHGLAVRMDGSAWPEAEAMNGPLRVVVYTANPHVGPGDAFGLIAKYAPSLAPSQEARLAERGVSTWRTADGQLDTEFWPAGSTATMQPPPPKAVGDLHFYRASLVAVVMRLAMPGRRCLPAWARLLGECALSLAAATEGICIDQLGFRVLTPDDLIFG
jgi:hypothetical protein